MNPSSIFSTSFTWFQQLSWCTLCSDISFILARGFITCNMEVSRKMWFKNDLKFCGLDTMSLSTVVLQFEHATSWYLQKWRKWVQIIQKWFLNFDSFEFGCGVQQFISLCSQSNSGCYTFAFWPPPNHICSIDGSLQLVSHPSKIVSEHLLSYCVEWKFG